MLKTIAKYLASVLGSPVSIRGITNYLISSGRKISPNTCLLYTSVVATGGERITRIAKEAEGFVYCVSSLGVTGMRSAITTDIGAMVKLVKAAKNIPCAVGFGISTPQQAGEMAAKSDGAIVGSAIVKLCEKYGADCVPHVKEYVTAMKEGVLRG